MIPGACLPGKCLDFKNSVLFCHFFQVFYILHHRNFIITTLELYQTIVHQIPVSKNSDPDRVSVKVLKGDAKLFHYHVIFVLLQPPFYGFGKLHAEVFPSF